MKNEIKKRIAEIDAIVKQETGIDLEKLVQETDKTRKNCRMFDLTPVVVGNEVFLVKTKLKATIF